jgi:type I restriction enzyme, S subunit
MAIDDSPPPGWNAVRIEDIAEVRFSGVDKHSREGECEVVLCNYMDVWKNPYIRKSLQFMPSTASSRDIERFSLRVGDVLITKDSETKNEIAEPSVVDESIENLVLGYHLALLRPNGNCVLGHFLAAQLRLPLFRNQFINKAAGATRYGLGLDAVKTAIVWIPGLQTQSAICKVLRAVDDAIEATRRVIEQNCKLQIALLENLLTEGLPGKKVSRRRDDVFGQVPNQWQTVSLTQIVMNERGSFVNGPFGSDLLTSEFTTSGTPVLYIQDIRHGKFSKVTNVFVSNDKADALEVCKVRSKDVLVTKVGDPPCISALYPAGEPPGIITQDLIRLRLNQDIACSEFVTQFLNSARGRQEVERILITGTRDRVSLSDYKETKILLPPLEEQRLIANSVDALGESQQKNMHLESQLMQLKAALTQGLLTGRINVNKGCRMQRIES